MIPDATTLPYQSREGGELEPGEVVLWDGAPEPIVRRRVKRSTIIWLFILAALGIAAGMYDASLPLVAVFALAFVILALFAMNDWFGVVDRTPSCAHRVTDRRVIRTQLRATPPMTQVRAADLFDVTIRRDRRGRAFVHFNGGGDEPGNAMVILEGVADAPAVANLALSLPRRNDRRAKVRRGRATPLPRSATLSAVDDTRPMLPDDVALLDGEVILWHGTPRKWDRIGARWFLGKGLTLALMAIPIAVLLAATGQLGPRLHVSHWLSTCVAAIWLWVALYSLTIQPFRDARRRSRTRYYLTNVRAIIHVGGRRPVTNSVLLDMAGAVDLQLEPDGTGEVRLRIGAAFERIDRAAEVNDLMLQAIRAAGGPSSLTTLETSGPRGDDRGAH